MRATRQRKDARQLRIDKRRGREWRGAKNEERERERSRSPLKKKKNGLWCRATISLGAKMSRVVLDRGISSGWLERGEQNTSNLLLYNAGLSVSIQRFQGAQHVGNPHTLHYGLHFRGNSYEILCRNLDQISPYEFITLAKTRDFHYSLSLLLFLSCPFFFRALRDAEAVRYTRVGMKRSWPLAQDFVAIRKFLVGKQGCKYA